MLAASPATYSNSGGKLTFQIPKPVTVCIQAEARLRAIPEAVNHKELKSLTITKVILLMGLILSSKSVQKIHVFPSFPLGSLDAFIE
jgi:hypothetical protein